MGWLLSVVVEGFLDMWCSLRGTQRQLDESSTVGQSEFEKEGPGLLWAIVFGAGLLALILVFVLRR